MIAKVTPFLNLCASFSFSVFLYPSCSSPNHESAVAKIMSYLLAAVLPYNTLYLMMMDGNI